MVWTPSATPPLPTKLNDMLPLIVSSRNFSNMCVEINGDKMSHVKKLSANKCFRLVCILSFLDHIKLARVDFQRAMQWQSLE